MKTIFVTSFHGLISRNILTAGVLEELLKSHRVVVICLEKKKAFFEKEFSQTGAIIEGIKNERSLRAILLRYLAFAALDTTTMKLKRKTEMKGSGSILSVFLGNNFGRVLVRGVARLLPFSSALLVLIDRYRPDLMFSTDLQDDMDVLCLQTAKQMRIKTVGMVRSWDNLSAKGIIRVVPDRLVVNNYILMEEAVRLHRIPSPMIKVVGIPHYDRYVREQRRALPSRIYKERLGVQDEKLLLYIPTGDRYLNGTSTDLDLIKIILQNLPISWSVFVRLPPADSVKGIEELHHPALYVQRPSVRFRTLKNTELTKEDDLRLMDTIMASDIVVSGPSTMCIDAAFFDKPVILVGFDGAKEQSYYRSIRRYYDYNHFQPILKSGGAPLAHSAEELIRYIHQYNNNWMLDREKRKKIVEEECVFTDGSSVKRLTDTLVQTFHA